VFNGAFLNARSVGSLSQLGGLSYKAGPVIQTKTGSGTQRVVVFRSFPRPLKSRDTERPELRYSVSGWAPPLHGVGRSRQRRGCLGFQKRWQRENIAGLKRRDTGGGGTNLAASKIYGSLICIVLQLFQGGVGRGRGLKVESLTYRTGIECLNFKGRRGKKLTTGKRLG